MKRSNDFTSRENLYHAMTKVLYLFWDQGWDQAPELVQRCDLGSAGIPITLFVGSHGAIFANNYQSSSPDLAALEACCCVAASPFRPCPTFYAYACSTVMAGFGPTVRHCAASL